MQHVYQDAVESARPCLVPCFGSQQRLLIMMLENVPFHGACTMWLSLLELMVFWHLSPGHFFAHEQNNVVVSPLLLSVHAFWKCGDTSTSESPSCWLCTGLGTGAKRNRLGQLKQWVWFGSNRRLLVNAVTKMIAWRVRSERQQRIAWSLQVNSEVSCGKASSDDNGQQSPCLLHADILGKCTGVRRNKKTYATCASCV